MRAELWRKITGVEPAKGRWRPHLDLKSSRPPGTMIFHGEESFEGLIIACLLYDTIGSIAWRINHLVRLTCKVVIRSAKTANS